MENLNKISKSLFYLCAISFAIFLGSYIVKLSLINQLFVAEDLSLKDAYLVENLGIVLKSFLPAFSISLVSFIVLHLSFILLLIFSRINLKEQGWLFIITLLLIITAVFETYLLVFVDIKVINELMKSVINSELILVLLKQRISELGPFPLILLFSYLAIIYLMLFKPLQKKV